MDNDLLKTASPIEFALSDVPDDLFRRASFDEDEAEALSPHVSYWSDVWRRFFENKSAVVFLTVFIIILLGCYIIPLVSPLPITGIIDDSINAKMSSSHWLGADKFGHDFFTKMWKGGQISFMVGFVSAILQTIIGVIIGAVSAYAGGRVDSVIMSIVNVLIAIPYLVIVLAIRVVAGAGTATIIFALVITGWLNVARLTRGQILQLKTEEYVTAAKSMGVGARTILARHLIPNTLGVILVAFTLAIPQAMFSEAFLSFIGLGTNAVSWGSLIRAGMDVRFKHPQQLIAPSILLALTMLCVQLIGDTLRDALDPKLRR
ncbi:MAG: ABC transporter permease [Oscillospiraceae bacterium]|jgi:oligopeptide transport system permease protein|nr:ABC transporter permease [Oscillospiraceae bacterium]